MTVRVFVSHSHEDKARYSKLCRALDQSGVARWDASRLSPGQPLAEGLRAAIEECDVCVFLATAHSLESRWCLAEVGAFWGAGKQVIVFLADPAVQESNLPPQFRGNLWTTKPTELVRGIKEAHIGRVRKVARGYGVVLGQMALNVVLGRLEEVDCHHDDCLVALPANEFFDDECIHDSNSALGAFLQCHFKQEVAAVQKLVKNALANVRGTKVRKAPGSSATSYGIGHCVYLARPLSSRLRLAMVAVTTQRADVGLHAEAANIFEAAAALQRVMANHRLTRLYAPILGSGHGGVKGEVSLFSMLIAFGELRRRSTQNIKEINIVVFRSSENAPPSISEVSIRDALNFVSRYLAE